LGHKLKSNGFPKVLVTDERTISIIVFIDGASLLKKAGKAWAMFGMISDMDPSIRNSFGNIITFFMIGTNTPDINKFFSKYMDNYETMINHGIFIEKIGKIKIKQIGFIGDSQAIPRVFNCKQYNGENGCLHCLQKGTTYESSLLRTYPYEEGNCFRSNTLYQTQVKESQITGNESYGIKGPCWMSKFIKIPENVILDYMHVCCIGTMQQQLELWSLSNISL
jgi:hypothetical protein